MQAPLSRQHRALAIGHFCFAGTERRLLVGETPSTEARLLERRPLTKCGPHPCHSSAWSQSVTALSPALWPLPLWRLVTRHLSCGLLVACEALVKSEFPQ